MIVPVTAANGKAKEVISTPCISTEQYASWVRDQAVAKAEGVIFFLVMNIYI
jgi:hypothetical protein